MKNNQQRSSVGEMRATTTVRCWRTLRKKRKCEHEDNDEKIWLIVRSTFGQWVWMEECPTWMKMLGWCGCQHGGCSGVASQVLCHGVLLVLWSSLVGSTDLGSRSPLHTFVHSVCFCRCCACTNRHDYPCTERLQGDKNNIKWTGTYCCNESRSNLYSPMKTTAYEL